jgi:hypothetical protein
MNEIAVEVYLGPQTVAYLFMDVSMYMHPMILCRRRLGVACV